MSDSDETMDPDSDETLPPDEEDRVGSPDLFDDYISVPVKKTKSNSDTLKERRSKAHEISDSGSDSENITKYSTDVIKEHRGTKKNRDKSNDNSKGKGDEHNSSKNKSMIEQSEKRKFLDEFLTMTDSDSESEYDKNKKNLQAFKEKAKKNVKNHQNGSPASKDKTSVQGRTQSPTLVKNVDKHHFSQKPHKKDYSTPYKKDTSSQGYKGTDLSSQGTKSSDTNSQSKKGSSDTNSQPKKGSDTNSQAKKGSDPSSQAKKGSSDTNSQPKKGSDTNSQAKKGSDTNSQAKKGSDTNSQAKKGSDPSSQGKKGSDTNSQAKKGSDPSSQAKKGSDTNSEAKKGSDPSSQGKKGSDPSSQGKKGSDTNSQAIKSFFVKNDSDVHNRSSPGNKRNRSRSPVPQELRKAVKEILNKDKNNSANKKKKPCQYGSQCYRKNPSHFEEFSHPGEEDTVPASKKQKLDTSSTTKARDRSESPSVIKSKVRSDSPSTSKVKDRSDTKVKVEKPSEAKTRSTSPSPSTSTVKTHSPTPDCKVVKRSRSPCRNPKTLQDKFELAQPYSFFLTKVAGISDKYNSTYVMDIKDILSEEMGTLTASCQFNYMFDIQWLMKQYPTKNRSKPLMIVHGEQGPSMAALQAQAMSYTNIRFCQAKLEMMYGTHHTKMMLLLYEEGMRVVIHTSNLIEQDWHQKTQGMWISPLFPKLQDAGKDLGDSPTNFKKDLINYIQAYKAYQLKDWVDHISQHDMSSARVVVIGSVPGRHKDATMSSWGHLKLRKCLSQHGPAQATVKAWPVIGQFSSIGSMGPNKENWLCGEWLQSLSAVKSCSGPQANVRLQLIFPSRHNVRLSLEGYPAGGSIPYTASTAKKQTFLHDFFHVWKAEGRGRSRAMPHIKSYARPMQDGSKAAWFLVTSANLSKAAWGASEKKGTQLMIRSYEIGVLFLPKFFGEGEVFPLTSQPDLAATTNQFLLPYDLPPTIYDKQDRPWMWDIPYMDLPDTNGNVWCPFSK